MKIEKVNDNQIRCTLTRDDLASRELKISELAYGTEKAKNLFRDMMKQANYEFGFEAEDIPLMIEAIPLNSECIVLVITKVEDPEELDTRFSRFAPSVNESMEDEYDLSEDDLDGSDDVVDLFRRLQESRKGAAAQTLSSEETEEDAPTDLVRLFSMHSLQDVILASKQVSAHFSGTSSLYKDEKAKRYLLLLNQNGMALADFNRSSNILSEYGSLLKSTVSGQSYLDEHFAPMIKEHALQSLSVI